MHKTSFYEFLSYSSLPLFLFSFWCLGGRLFKKLRRNKQELGLNPSNFDTFMSFDVGYNIRITWWYILECKFFYAHINLHTNLFIAILCMMNAS